MIFETNKRIREELALENIKIIKDIKEIDPKDQFWKGYAIISKHIEYDLLDKCKTNILQVHYYYTNSDDERERKALSNLKYKMLEFYLLPTLYDDGRLIPVCAKK